MKKLGCDFSHYEAKQGYVCKIESTQKKCKYDPPNFQRCLEDFKKEMERREMEGIKNVM